jgi:hypothetical protein
MRKSGFTLRQTCAAVFLLCPSLALAEIIVETGKVSDLDRRQFFRDQVNVLLSPPAETGAAAAHLVDNMLARDVTGDGVLGRDDVEIWINIEIARRRGQHLGNLFSDDVDGDGVVTREDMAILARTQSNRPLRSGEIVLVPTAEQRASIEADILAKMMRPDSNGDGKISTDEWLGGIFKESGYKEAEAARANFSQLLAVVDANGDGRLTRDEMEPQMLAFVTAVDSNQNGRLSRDEIRGFGEDQFKSGLMDAILGKSANRCKAAAPVEGAAVMAIGAREGAALTDLHMGQTENEVTTALDVNIPQGAGAVHLVVQFHAPTIVRLRGATKRVQAVTNIGNTIGFTGIASGQLKRFEQLKGECQKGIWDGAVKDDALQKARLSGVFDGFSPVLAVVGYELGDVNLEAGTANQSQLLEGAVVPGYTGAAAETWSRMLTFHPGGLVEIDPASVVSTQPVQKLPVWPGDAGLASLLDRGVLELRNPNDIRAELKEVAPGVVKTQTKTLIPGLGDDVIQYNDLDYIEESPGLWVGRPRREFVIKSSTPLPVGIAGAVSARFFLPDGIPLPEGPLNGIEFAREDAEE